MHRAEDSLDQNAERFRSALRALADAERKSGYDPHQPRVPAGQGRESGQWARLMSALGKLAVADTNRFADEMVTFGNEVLAPFKPAVQAALRAAPPEVQAFIRDNQESIQRTFGAVQAIAGGSEAAVGAELMTAGAVALPEGAPAVLAGAILTAHGADELRTGLRVLATGEAEPGAFYAMLRSAGLDENAAQLALASASGIPAVAAKSIPLSILKATAEDALERESLTTLLSKGRVLTDDGSSVFDGSSIATRGELTERDALRINGGRRTGATFKTFDLVVDQDDGSVHAISVKSLDARTDRYLRDNPAAMYPRMKKMIDDVADFRSATGRHRNGGRLQLEAAQLSSRQLDLYLPAGFLIKGQKAQIATARAYAAKGSVMLVTRYVH